MAVGYLITLCDPRIERGAPIETPIDNHVHAVDEYRDLLATMWRRPGARLQLEHGAKVIAEFHHYNPDREGFNALLIRRRGAQC